METYNVKENTHQKTQNEADHLKGNIEVHDRERGGGAFAEESRTDIYAGGKRKQQNRQKVFSVSSRFFSWFSLSVLKQFLNK